MYRRFNRLLFIALSAALLALLAGCTQPDDVLSPVSTTKLILRPERLPTLPQGLIYELWLKKSNDDVISLGKFGWDSRLYRFYDAAGNTRDSLWEVNFDALQGKSLIISVESNPDPQPSVMGSVMLADTLVDPSVRPMKMIFPRDFWLAAPEYCVTSPTDGNSYTRQASGLWFTAMEFKELVWSDTTNFRQFIDTRGTRIPLEIDTVWDDTHTTIIRIDTTNIQEWRDKLVAFAITNERPDTNFNYRLPDGRLVLDTIVHIGRKCDSIFHHLNVDSLDTAFYTDTIREVGRPDSIINLALAPFQTYQLTLMVDTILRRDTFDLFLGPFDSTADYVQALNLEGTGWHYKGWVVSPSIPGTSNFPKLTRPSWNNATVDYVINPTASGMLTTGTFTNFLRPDDGNPYSQNRRVPRYPGEDFLDNLPSGLGPRGVYLADSANRNAQSGTVFVSLEPDNFSSDSTNFPLIIFTSQGRLPSYSAASVVKDLNMIIYDIYLQFPLTNWSSAVNGNTAGFPAVHVDLIRQ
ncbi:exported hypothetical protein [Candidatus Zixiibacteriota bacterium]|nr:exported hypothetical protein [candidate division Zixibacteria bacterium]